jgi:glycerol-3-phosphate dehydrogenase
MSPARAEIQQAIEASIYDLCVIGGGATGAGCALDAQLRGLRTVLIEADDFASKTSSASTKMAHGGVRYLQAAVANRDIRQYHLVRDALPERAMMIRNAPHLAAPLEFVVPCFRRAEQLYYGIGLKAYDWIAGDGRLGRSRILSAPEALQHLPTLQPTGLVGAATYTDGQFDDARYCLALIITFTEAGGIAFNHARVVDFQKHNGRIAAAAVEDQLSKQVFTVRARAFVNATGPCSDAVRHLASPNAAPRLSPSKGVHVIFPMPADWGDNALLVPKTEDGRVIFALPYHGRLMVGTTDTAASASAEMVVTRDEIDYLMRQINPYLAGPLSASDIVSGFAGLRPLVRSNRPTNTSDLIRDDEVEVDPDSGLISILGGKWTTYRLMAEKTIDRISSAACVTRTTLLAGSEGYHPEFWREIAQHGLQEPTARHLARKYGTLASDVLRLAGESPDLRRPLIDGAPPIRAEVVYAIRHEMAVTVEDVLARRIGLELYDWRMAMEAAPIVADLMSREPASNVADAYVAKIQRLLDAAAAIPRPDPRTSPPPSPRTSPAS